MLIHALLNNNYLEDYLIAYTNPNPNTSLVMEDRRPLIDYDPAAFWGSLWNV